MSDNVTCSIMSWRGWYLYEDLIVKKDSKKTWFFVCSLPHMVVMCSQGIYAHPNSYFIGSEKQNKAE